MVADDVRSIIERLHERDRVEVGEFGAPEELVAQLFAGPYVMGRIFSYDDVPRR